MQSVGGGLLVLLGLTVIAVVAALWYFSRKGEPPVSESFDALRAFGVEGDDGDGPSYFVELTDRRVLFINSQQPRTSCVVKLHRRRGHVVELVCSGMVLDPEVMTLPFSRSDRKQKRVPKNGTIITGKSYEAIKSERLAAASMNYE